MNMKTVGFVLSLLCPVLMACEMSSLSSVQDQGELRISFEDVGMSHVKSYLEIPDTSDFILTVSGAGGKVLYDGAYGSSPESMMVSAGSYTISVRSCEFTRPAFSAPQFGDEQCVVVPSGGVASVRLVCRQLNSGIRLNIDKSFLTGCSDGALFLKSSQGKLMYSYSEKRTAYFSPGNVSLMFSSSGNDKILMTRTLKPQDMLVVNVSASLAHSPSSSPSEIISVAVDTSRIWSFEDYVIGGSAGGGSVSEALTVTQAIASAGENGVWVSGYIVGGDLTSSSASFDAPFASRTNLLLGSRSSTSSRESCLSVQLSSGDVRDALNLVDNPSLIGRKVMLKGDVVESYYGLVGIKNITDYELK